MSVTGVDPKALEFVLGQISDGAIFERFAKEFLAAVLGYEFVPVGGVRDESVDALRDAFEASGVKRTIYQMSVEADSRAKIRRTLVALRQNKIAFQRLVYVTNRKVARQATLGEDLFKEFGKPVTIWDVEWFKANVNSSVGTVRVYNVFAETYVHAFSQPGKSYEVRDLSGDPHLYVFLRQLWDEERENLPVEEILADGLIQYALEGTDPDKGLVMKGEEILRRITEVVQFDSRRIEPIVERRLKVLSGTRPRRVIYDGRFEAYCLPYASRLVIRQRNIDDLLIYGEFRDSVGEKARQYCLEAGAGDAYDAYSLVEQVLHLVFKKQGLDFAQFVLSGDSSQAMEQFVPDIVAHVVDFSPARPEVREALKKGILLTIRELVYRGTEVERSFLARLAKTYTMLFLLQCDPTLVSAFAAMAGKLKVYVCTSVLIPALSEYFLEPENQRYGNLLKRARDAGAELRVNELIINELAAHFRMIKQTFEDYYSGLEAVYDDELRILYVAEMLIRSYFYCRLHGEVSGFDQFLDTFVSRRMSSVEGDLISWLDAEFGIKYVSDQSLGVSVDAEEEEAVRRELEGLRRGGARPGGSIKAKTDARMVLGIRALREKNNEAASGILGYETWWLSMDTSTERAARRALGSKFGASCCMRADFLNQFVCLAPSRSEVDRVFKEAFPGLLGVSLSYHLPPSIVEMTRRLVKDHADKPPARIKGILRELMDRLKTEATFGDIAPIRHFLDEKRAELEKE